MALEKWIKKVLIIGSGPIIIGQAAEFDYSGTQACKSMREEGIETILVNSNPATIMTDSDMADKIYIEPLNIESLEKIIEKERPDGVLAGFGGQTALNLAMEIEEQGILKKYNCKLLGINSEAIKKAEDRDEFKKLMTETKQPIPKSIIATELNECIEFVEENGLPVIIRPAYTLGGTGGGIASTDEELIEICSRGIEMSPIGQILLEQSVAGWKEIEYEVIRDKKDNCIVICNMENIDPVGVHTGDSIVVAPSQTLRDSEYQMLRKASIDIIRSLKIEGGCNVQFALDTKTSNYIVIEVNPRVSRSSALASKVTGYPIAKIASKIAVGYSLDELKNTVTGTSSACFEPTLDYCVVKIPKWPFDKFGKAMRTLGTQMKATGEVMAIERNFEGALLKAVNSLDAKVKGLKLTSIMHMDSRELADKIKNRDDERLFAIAEGLRRGYSVEKINDLTGIDIWFLNAIHNIVLMENKVAELSIIEDEEEIVETIKKAYKMGFSSEELGTLTGFGKDAIMKMKEKNNIAPVYKIVDTCGGEFEAQTPYYYSSYDIEDENVIEDKKKVVVLGSGPIRIGQGIEFDYCCVHGVLGLKERGYESIIINNNPETVSTDFDTANKLYFDPLNVDNVMNIIKREKPEGVIVQFGGQTAINLAEKLQKFNVNILGTSFHSIDLAEDRDKFRSFLEELNIPSPLGTAVTSLEEAYEAVEKLGYPVVVRPSYVIGGRAMEVVYDKKGLTKYIKEAVTLSTEHPILIDKYVRGTEIEVDCLSDGEDILIPGIMEHIERTGVHSGDSITVYPSMTLSKETLNKLVDYTRKIAKGLKTIGLMNIQYVFDGKDVYVIEVNPRASRTVPILSKVTNIPMVKLAVDLMLGKKVKELGHGTGLHENSNLYAVKVPVFSGEKLSDVDMYLGPEMKSTGEVLGVDKDLRHAIYKGFRAANVKIVTGGNLYVSLREVDKEEGIELVKNYMSLGFNIFASENTSEYLKDSGVNCECIKLNEVAKSIKEGKINVIINTPTRGNNNETKGFKLRRKAAEHRVPLFTCVDTAKAFLIAIEVKKNNEVIEYRSMEEYF